MRERVIEAYLRDKVKQVGGWAPKWTSPGNNGVPDRLVFFPGGKVELVELKAPGGKPSAIQLAQHRRLGALGQKVRIIDGPDQVDELIKDFREGRL